VRVTDRFSDFAAVYEGDDTLRKLEAALGEATGQTKQCIRYAIDDRKRELREQHRQRHE